MTDKLISEIKNIADFSAADIDLFLNSLSETFIKKGEHFLMLGNVSRHIGYIKSGLMMYYKIIDGVEVPADFAKENEWVAYLKSFSTGSISDMSIKAIEVTQILTLSNTAMIELFNKQPKFLALRNYYVELSFLRNIEHTSALSTLNAKQRYYKFMKDRSDLINRVPQYYIAAYLGIKPQSLSRIRK
ncbi:MAG: Crp/Fnr family transcriptional regulator [Flavobacterium sp.]|jgi:CRP-like cAMP-binding protein|nr:Crp/Fnr family transcriptional regulator [Flavobacterium sp.]